LVLKDLGELEEARKCFVQALRIDEATCGPNHPIVARDSTNLGWVLKDLGELEERESAERVRCLEEAKACFERALHIHEDEAAFGPNHSIVARDSTNLGWVLKDLKDLTGAKAYFERALRISEAALGSNHPTAVRDSTDLIKEMHQALDDLAKGES
jgi:tetratricopeptide (TPR) repeat protein